MENNGRISRVYDNGSYECEYSINDIINDGIDEQIEQLNEPSIASICDHFTVNHKLLSRTVKAKITRDHVIQRRENCPYEKGKGYIVAWSLGGTNHPLNQIPVNENFKREEYSILEEDMEEDISDNYWTYDSTYVIKFENDVPTEMVISTLIFEEKIAERCRIDIVDFSNNHIGSLFARMIHTTNKKVFCNPKGFEGLERFQHDERRKLKTRLIKESKKLAKELTKNLSLDFDDLNVCLQSLFFPQQ